MQFENAVTIRRSLSDVFAFLADFENVPTWNHAIAETHKVSEGPVGVGTQFQQVRTIPTRTSETFEVTVFDPKKELAIQGTLGPFDASLRYRLEPTPEGTRIFNRVDLQGRGAAKLITGFAAGRVKSAVEANLETLKQLLESRPP